MASGLAQSHTDPKYRRGDRLLGLRALGKVPRCSAGGLVRRDGDEAQTAQGPSRSRCCGRPVVSTSVSLAIASGLSICLALRGNDRYSHGAEATSVGSGRREGDRGCSSLEGPDQRHGLGWHRPVGWDEAEAGLSATRYLCWATLASAKLEAGKSYTFVLAGKPRKYDIVKIEDAVAVQPNQ